MTRRTIGACAVLLLTMLAHAHATEVEVRGAVASPGTRKLPERARLSDAALAASVSPDAYLLGAAWMRPSQHPGQQRLKAGLLFDLDVVRQQALQSDRVRLAELARSMGAWLQSLPVTGRQTALLDPRAVEVAPTENRLVADGDVLYYPQRPYTIRVVGAVAHACELPSVALQDARRYLRDCPVSPMGDADWIFAIQPDGRVFRLGIAPWNRSAPLPLAPGALIYVPLRESLVHAVAPDLNRELAGFLATQTLAESVDGR